MQIIEWSEGGLYPSLVFFLHRSQNFHRISLRLGIHQLVVLITEKDKIRIEITFFCGEHAVTSWSAWALRNDMGYVTDYDRRIQRARVRCESPATVPESASIP